MTKNEYIQEITLAAAKKSTCNRAKVGCVIATKDYEVVTTGYNGAPRGIPSCEEIGHRIERGHCVATVHAEQNAIIQAAKHGVSIKGCILYSTHSPCIICSKMIINAGIIEIRYREIYNGSGLLLLQQAGIKVSPWTI